MTQNDFDRLNLLSDKTLAEGITQDELKEFKQLMDDWNISTEFNLMQGFYAPSKLFK